MHQSVKYIFYNATLTSLYIIYNQIPQKSKIKFDAMTQCSKVQNGNVARMGGGTSGKKFLDAGRDLVIDLIKRIKNDNH